MAVVFPPNQIFITTPKPLEKVVGGEVNGNFDRLERDAEGRILSYATNKILPSKGLIYPQAAKNNLIMKGIMMSTSISLLTFRPTVKWLEQTLDRVNILADRVYRSDVPSGDNKCAQCGASGRLVRSDFMQYAYYNACSQELWHITYLFFRKLGVNSNTAYVFGRLVATVIEYELPYRLRAEDIFTEINQAALLANPYKEINRVLKLYLKRESYTGDYYYAVANKFLRLFKFFSLLFYVPKIGNALKFAIKNADFKKLRLDQIDLHEALFRADYDFMGRNLKERQEIAKQFYASQGYNLIFNE